MSPVYSTRTARSKAPMGSDLTTCTIAVSPTPMTPNPPSWTNCQLLLQLHIVRRTVCPPPLSVPPVEGMTISCLTYSSSTIGSSAETSPLENVAKCIACESRERRAGCMHRACTGCRVVRGEIGVTSMLDLKRDRYVGRLEGQPLPGGEV